MDTNSIILIGSIVVANIGTSIGLFMWATNRAADDTKQLRESAEKSSAEMRMILQSIQVEMKDFHGRLCAIEERYQQRVIR